MIAMPALTPRMTFRAVKLRFCRSDHRGAASSEHHSIWPRPLIQGL